MQKLRDIYAGIRAKLDFLEVAVLSAFLLLWFCISGFLEIADDVGEGDTHSIDTSILMMMRDKNNPDNPWGPPLIEEMARDISGLGGIAVLTLVTLGAAFYLFMMRRPGRALYLLFTIGMGTLISNLLKYGYDRPRPNLVPHGSYHLTSSFPSGHSMMAALVYLTIGMLIASTHKTLNLKLYFIILPVIITMMVGISRVYLGVHWPSDVLAGWAMGAACALLFWLIEWMWEKKIFSLLLNRIRKRP